ncbi:ribosome biogenesis GTPase Der [Echinimonas agarilytica]|uniref:GTPase Der n=1 Tax=Echinimonas agarilytica TaxID=1215918 RepID=A0AA41W807_9GAMM|nr:ribosome biogenesis GTPase Der [Echinimonas agarilytica]MCM2680133.1 ribosome biogenesis GTPase Der [Echinimonas agarilytica]
MVPVIALVGRPNVGKSTLFNRLTRTRDALVADFPGLTRDRQYGHARFGESEFIVIDTAGIYGDEEGIDALMVEQSMQAVVEADLVFFMVDARDGLTATDQEIAGSLRRQEKQTVLLVNKVDGVDEQQVMADFYKLGMKNMHGVAAAQGRGINQLLEQTIESLAETLDSEPDLDQLADSLADESHDFGDVSEFDDIDEFDEQTLEAIEAGELDDDDKVPFDDVPIKLAIVGRPNVGKSTLTNRILGEDRVVVYDMPGTTRDSVYIPMERDDQDYILIDTAGIRRRSKVNESIEKFSVIKTLQAIEDSNVVLLVLDAHLGVSDQDLSLLGFVLNAGRSLVVVVNKWDGLSNDERQRIKDELDRRLGFVDFARVHFISALHGSGVGHLFESVKEAYVSATTRVSTSKLTRILRGATEDHNPPMVRGRRSKLRYAHAGGYNPPLLVVHGTMVNSLPGSYKRYLTNYFRRSLKIMGSPIRLDFKEGDNPFKDRKNSLTLSQVRKRKRLMSYIKSRK